MTEAQPTYEVVINRVGPDQARVFRLVKTLTSWDEGSVRRILRGARPSKPIMILTGLSLSDARVYRTALSDAGAEAIVREKAAPQAPTEPGGEELEPRQVRGALEVLSDLAEGWTRRPEVLCPHCQVRGRVGTRTTTPLSGGKLFLGIMTAGITANVTGLKKKKAARSEARCGNCGVTWGL